MHMLRSARSARLLWLGALLAPVLATAQMRPVAPGSTPKLQPGEGLLLVAVDADRPIDSARLRDARGNYSELGELPAGQSYALFAAPAGEYTWRDVAPADGSGAVPLSTEDFRFDLDAGELNYAGDLVLRGDAGADAVARVNRSTNALDWISRAFPRLKRKHTFRMASNVPDAFPAWYAERGAERAAGQGGLPATPVRDLPLPVATLFSPPAFQRARMNAAGNRVALQARGADGAWNLEVVDLGSGVRRTLEGGADTLAGLEWAADDTLLATHGVVGQAQRGSLLRLANDGVERIDVAQAGVVIDTVPGDERHLLYATAAPGGGWELHRLDFAARRSARLGDDEVARYAKVAAFAGHDGFDAVPAAPGATRVVGVTDAGRAQRELVSRDIATGRETTLFARPGIDVDAPILDARRHPIGASYVQRGRRVADFFDRAHEDTEALIGQEFADESVTVLDVSEDGNTLIVAVESAGRAPVLYHLDVAARRAEAIRESRPALDHHDFAPTHVVDVHGRDGHRIEALLTLPDVPGQRPLVVMPHGGPVGIADRLDFNREALFLASQGYAVLRVNFRGSDGRGRAFREAGHGEYGRAIEDDIDAAIRKVALDFPVDTGRMCALGASYGGYSALVAAARWPGRFKCAVSIAGISDLSLMFSASDAGRSEEGRALLGQLIGDPVRDAAAMRDVSPVYLADRIDVPVMLVHGLADTRVDPEHFYRMTRALALAGNTPVTMTFGDEGHGVERPENLEVMWEGIAGFLRRHLAPPVTLAAR